MLTLLATLCSYISILFVSLSSENKCSKIMYFRRKTLIVWFSTGNVTAESNVIPSPIDVIMPVTSNRIGENQFRVASRYSMYYWDVNVNYITSR